MWLIDNKIMANTTAQIPITDIFIDNTIYPREKIDPKRIGIFAEYIRDGYKFDPIEVQPHPEKPGKYRILDGAHRWNAYKSIGETELEVIIKDLDGVDPLLYAATKAIGPKQLTEEETRNTARRAYQNNPKLTSSEIGKAIGRARRTVDSYIADLRAVIQMDLEIKIFRMNRLGVPQDRIANRLSIPQKTISDHLAKKAALPNPLNADLSRGFTVPQVAEKYGWTEPMVWSIALEGKSDLMRFKELNWGLRTWDLWEWNDCDRRFGDEWPGRIPAQLIGHILYYFSNQNGLVFDPMGGGGVTADTCLALGRKCWTMDMIDRPDIRPEIEQYYWDKKGDFESASTSNPFPLNSKEKPDLIILDPPYFDKKAKSYDKKSISMLPKKEYLAFFECFLAWLRRKVKKTARLAFINANWRNFQNTPAIEESPEEAILIFEYHKIFHKTGWQPTHVIQAPCLRNASTRGLFQPCRRKRYSALPADI